MPPVRDRNLVSIWFFFFVPLLEAIPIVGFVFMLIWAFSGDNKSRQNYCRARLLAHLLVLAFIGAIVAAGFYPAVMKAVHKAEYEASQSKSTP